MSARRVVVTGIGAVGPFGSGVARLWDLLVNGRAAFQRITLFDVSRHRTAIGGEVPAEEVRRLARAHGAKPTATRSDLFALEAAREALLRAGLDPADAPAAGVYLGSSTGGMLEGERLYFALASGDAGRGRSARVDRVRAQPLGCSAEAVARALGWRGPVETISAACAAATMALEAALDSVRSGEVDVALAGGADGLCELTYGGFNSLRAVSPEPCRPFRADRVGLSMGEGAGLVVLESLDSARRRGATILAELAGAGSSCDAHHMTAPEPEGRGASRAVAAALADARIAPGDVDFVNAHGTGTPHNDPAERNALARVFGERLRALPLTSTKGSVGHLLGACGGLEAVATVLSLDSALVPPTPGDGPVGDDCAVDLVLGAPREPTRCAVAVSLNLAFGGANAAAVLRRFAQASERAPAASEHAVVVTGAGHVSAAGAGLDALAAALRAGPLPASEVDRSAGLHREDAARTAALVDEETLVAWVPQREGRRMSPASRCAVAAARMAIAQAGLGDGGAGGPDTAVALGTAYGSTGYTARLLEQVRGGGPRTISPFLFMETVASAHAGQIALALAARGPSYTVSQGEASGLLAVARGAELVARGRARRALVGVVDEVSPVLHAVLDRLGALAKSGRALPFGAERSGSFLSEGATVLVLEREEDARARGARVLARLAGWVRAHDPSARTAAWGTDGRGLASALRRGLARRGIAVESIERIVSGASGSVRGDRLEASTLRELVRERPLPDVFAPKGLTGELGGGFLGAALLLLAGGELGSAGSGHAEAAFDPELGVEPARGAFGPARRALWSALGSGGAAAWLVVDRTS